MEKLRAMTSKKLRISKQLIVMFENKRRQQKFPKYEKHSVNVQILQQLPWKVPLKQKVLKIIISALDRTSPYLWATFAVLVSLTKLNEPPNLPPSSV